MRHRLIPVLAFAVGLSALLPFASGKVPKKPGAQPRMDEQKRALQALNRLTFGPRNGDLERVQAMGVDKWIEQQLHPDRIDDIAVESRLTAFPTLAMSTRQLVENFPPPQLIRAIADGKQSMPSDPIRHAIYEAELDRFEQKQQNKQDANAADAEPSTEKMSRVSATQEFPPLKSENLWAMEPQQRFQAVLALSGEERREFLPTLKGKLDAFLEGMTPRQRETMQALNHPQEVVSDELVEAKLLREIYSDRQLQEVMTDFWLNHFNVFVGKGMDRYFLTSYERDVIRPHALGKFEDLLDATAESPAMLFYLDNWLSEGPDSDKARGFAGGFGRPQRPKAKQNGLNENYGRELMELHTLGVNGGYTQKDVTEVARVFTGWTLKEPRQGGDFFFNPRMHEPGDKMVLGHRIKPDGQKEGFEVLHILAHHPATAKFICTKLAMRFVSDNPPPELVSRMAKTFLKKDGNIADVLKTMFDSPEFWSDQNYRAKVKTPLEFVVSSIRASGADVNEALPLARQLQHMGMPLYGMQPPTGYSMKADAWVNSSALLDRMNFALALTSGKIRGTRVDPQSLLNQQPESDVGVDPSQQALAVLENLLLAGDVSKQTHETIAARLEDPEISQRKLDDPVRAPNMKLIEGLLLGSPEFQRR
jgi:uncharacterized protein (DUF1800 family)